MYQIGDKVIYTNKQSRWYNYPGEVLEVDESKDYRYRVRLLFHPEDSYFWYPENELKPFDE